MEKERMAGGVDVPLQTVNIFYKSMMGASF
jgi:hypothetical protein